MKYTFDVRVSQQDADIALRRFIFRGLGWSTLIAAILCLAYVVYDSLNDGIGHLGVATLTLLLILGLAYAVAFVVRRRQMADLLHRLGDTPVTYRLDETEIATASALGSSALKWEMIEKLWIDPDITLVFYSRNGYATIPTPQIPNAALDFLAAQVKRVGGSVADNQTKAEQDADPNA